MATTTTGDATAAANKDALHIVNPVTSEAQRTAIRAAAGRRKNSTTAEEWMDEVGQYRERIRQEEIERQDGAEGPK